MVAAAFLSKCMECMESCCAAAWASYCFISGCGCGLLEKVYSTDSASSKCSMMVFVWSDGIHTESHYFEALLSKRRCQTQMIFTPQNKRFGRSRQWQPQQGWQANKICTNQQLIRLSIKVKLLTCISLDGPSSGSIMADALGEP